MEGLVANLRGAYRASIRPWTGCPRDPERRWSSWTGSPPSGLPEKWRDYSTLEIDRDDLYGNAHRGYTVNYDRELTKLSEPVDRSNGT